MARDPYKYFRVEAQELAEGLGRGALDLEKGTGAQDLVVQMLRLAHTLKGAARVVRQTRIAEIAHTIEDLLEPHRDRTQAPATRERVDRLLALIDEIAAALAALSPEPAGPPSSATPSGGPPFVAEPLRSMRVAIEDMDSLLEGVFETNVQLAAVRRDLDELARGRRLASMLVELSASSARTRAIAEDLAGALARLDRELNAGLDRVDREVTQVRDKANELRLVPASVVFAPLERAVRDAAQALHKTALFEAGGGDHRLEANVLFAIRDALLHVVRNAVAHGIEPEAERRAQGKPTVGRVLLEVRQESGKLAFACSDDGRGIDVEAVRRSAVARGVASAAEAASLGAEQVMRLALESGVTTARQVDEVAGRGVGLDVLRTTVARLKGEVTLSSRPGQGTTVEVRVPLSVSSIQALLLEAGGTVASIPLDAVRRTMSLTAADVSRSAERESIVCDGEDVPFMALASAVVPGAAGARERAASGIGRSNGKPQARMWTAVVVHAGGRLAALGVDRLLGTTRLVVRPLPRLAGPLPFARGASLDADGDPCLVLDPQGLVDMAAGARTTAGGVTDGVGGATKPRAPILVIDDSLTTRMLEQSILESAGYAVDVATSAEEGLSKARGAPYSLFLVDVEMPGMDGFEFVTRTRADPELRSIPAILVTSRDAASDRRRGEEAGARAYIVKGEFDQGQLLRVIGELIG